MRQDITEDWLLEMDIAPSTASPQTVAGDPQSDPYTNIPAQNSPPDPAVNTMNQQNEPSTQINLNDKENKKNNKPNDDDVTKDPQTPDMPDEKPEIKDFETWKAKYLKESVKGDSNLLVELINMFRDKSDLTPYQKKFVEDNWNIQMIRMNSNVEKASKQIRKNLSDQLDKNSPSTSIVNNIVAVLDTVPMLNSVFIKLDGYAGLKGDLHRKYIGALLCCTQVGSGSNKEDLIYNTKEYSILISTRFNSQWGEVLIGSWSLKENDAERFLKEPELKRLRDGSPEEKDALRKRIIIDSIANLFEHRSFVINVVSESGVIYMLGWDIASSLRSAFLQGKFVVKSKKSDSSEAMFDDEGKIISLIDVVICYAKKTNEQDEDGNLIEEHIPFIERRNGTLFLISSLSLLKEVTNSLQGFSLKETPYNGNPSDLKTLVRCVYSSSDLLMRQC